MQNAYFRIRCGFSEVAISDLATGWDSAPTGQSFLSATSLVIHVKVLVDHSKMKHFIRVVQL
jgi:hypothetical protein